MDLPIIFMLSVSIYLIIKSKPNNSTLCTVLCTVISILLYLEKPFPVIQLVAIPETGYIYYQYQEVKKENLINFIKNRLAYKGDLINIFCEVRIHVSWQSRPVLHVSFRSPRSEYMYGQSKVWQSPRLGYQMMFGKLPCN